MSSEKILGVIEQLNHFTVLELAELSKALQEAWGFKAMTPKSTAYNNCKAKVAYWINVIFSESKPTAPTPFKLARGLTDKFIQFLSENNISDKDMKRAANALAANIILK